jgi:hypothetical protein
MTLQKKLLLPDLLGEDGTYLPELLVSKEYRSPTHHGYAKFVRITLEQQKGMNENE